MNSRKSAVTLQPTEAELHQTVAEYLDWALLPPSVYSTFPAGWGKLSRAVAGSLKSSGLKPGMPDIFVFDKHPLKFANRIFPKIVGIELKAHGGKPSAAQQLMFPRLRELGIPIYICESVEDVADAMTREHIALRIGFHPQKPSSHQFYSEKVKWRDVQQQRKNVPPAATSAKPADTNVENADGNP